MAYLGLAIWGAVHPTAWVAVWAWQNGLSPSGLAAGWHANAATTALRWDLTIAAVALVLWIGAEVRVRRNWSALLAIPVCLSIGVGCALPLYLFLRTRPV